MSTPAVVPQAHWYSTLWHVMRHVEAYVSDTFIALFGADAAHSFAIGAESLLRSDLGKIAMVAVQEANSMASGVDKRAAAFTIITDQAKASGLDIRDSLKNMLIELAVGKLKGIFGSTL